MELQVLGMAVPRAAMPTLPAMRVVVYGAGAIGGLIAGLLHAAGTEVVAIARGAHLDAIRSGGLRVMLPEGAATYRLPAAGHPDEVDFTPDDVVLLAMKSQHTTDALLALRAAAGDLPVVCAQNGVDNERAALRLFSRVYGMCVMCPASHTTPGVVVGNGTPHRGILDVGRYASGTDELAGALAGALTAAGFVSEPRPDIMRWKYRKLVMNVANAAEALCGPLDRDSELARRARAEAEDVFAAAGLDVATADEDRQRRGDLVRLRPVEGQRREGGSSWQSLKRGTGDIEADHLNGEVVLLGRLHGVPTPVNAEIQRLANRIARDGGAPDPAAAAALLR